MTKAFLRAALFILLAGLPGCSDRSESARPAEKGLTLQDVELGNLKWDQPEDRYAIGLHLVIVKVSKDVETGKPSIIALSTVCPKDGLRLPVLFLEKILHCPGCTSDFDFRGIKLRGPAPDDLLRYKISRDAQEGRIQVFLRTTFTHAGGGWKNPDAFLPIER